MALSLQSPATASVTGREVTLAQRISEVTRGLGLATEAGAGGRSPRSVQVLEIAIDALDIAAVHHLAGPRPLARGATSSSARSR